MHRRGNHFQAGRSRSSCLGGGTFPSKVVVKQTVYNQRWVAKNLERVRLYQWQYRQRNRERLNKARSQRRKLNRVRLGKVNSNRNRCSRRNDITRGVFE